MATNMSNITDMTDNAYLERAESALRAVELACDRINEDSDVDVDNQRVGAMVTLTFADRSQIVINLQKPLHEMWVAAKRGGYHFRWDGSQWMDTKGAGELFALLSSVASEQAKTALVFGPV
jgi:CyaY protein